MEDTHLILLGQIDGKVDIILANQSKHSDRITSLERDRWYAGGALAVLGAWAAKLHFLPSS
jgi:hypothetical protein